MIQNPDSLALELVDLVTVFHSSSCEGGGLDLGVGSGTGSEKLGKIKFSFQKMGGMP